MPGVKLVMYHNDFRRGPRAMKRGPQPRPTTLVRASELTRHMAIKQGDILWTPTADQVKQTRLAAFMDWLEKTQDRRMDSYEDLWKWSVEDLDQFWMSIWR